jgi:hypothetical protein
MEHVNLGSVIEQAVSRFGQNRIGDKPPVSVMIPPGLSHVPWYDGSLREFVRTFLYESLVRNDPDAAVEVALQAKVELRGLNEFVGVQPSYWVQLRVAGRGLKVIERLVEELFANVNYRCEEWVGAEDAGARLGIFGSTHNPHLKVVFCLESSRKILKCDLLVPVWEAFPLRGVPANGAKQVTLRT